MLSNRGDSGTGGPVEARVGKTRWRNRAGPLDGSGALANFCASL
jgi:hypothetical protein